MAETPNVQLPYPSNQQVATDVVADITALALKADEKLGILFTRTNPGQILARLTRASSTAVGSGSALPWDTAAHNPNGSWSAGAPTRFTATITGYHRIGGHIHHGPKTSGLLLSATIRANGSTTVSTKNGTANSSPSGGTDVPMDDFVHLTAGQYVEIIPANANAETNNYAGSLLVVSYAGL